MYCIILCRCSEGRVRSTYCLIVSSHERFSPSLYFRNFSQKDLKRFDNIFNAVKYSTSLFPICLSAYQKTLSAEEAHDFDALFVVLLM